MASYSSNLLNFIPVADGRRFDKKPEMKGDGARACVGCPPLPSPWGKSLNRMNIEFHLRPSNAMRAGRGWIVILAADKKKSTYLARKNRGQGRNEVFSKTCNARDQ